MTPEQRRVLQGAIRALPAQEALVIRLKMNGKSDRAIAVLLGYRSHWSVQWWRKKALRRLRLKIPEVERWLLGRASGGSSSRA